MKAIKPQRLGTRMAASGLLSLALLFFGVCSPAQAAGGGRGGNPVTKLIRGVVNVTTGWLEVPIQMVENKDETLLLWIPHGFFQGLMQGGMRTFLGAWDILSFPLAPYDAPLLEPDTLIEPRHPRHSTDTGPTASAR